MARENTNPSRQGRRASLWLAAIIVLAALTVPFASDEAHAQDTGWTIERFHSDMAIQPDTSLLVTEEIDVDFAGLQKHGIFRELKVRFNYNSRHERVYGLTVLSVTNADGKSWPYTRERNGANERIKIGDPDRTVSGHQSYRIAYRLTNALNPFPDHDELFWNTTGDQWSVPILRASATARLAGGGLEQAACFQGYAGAKDPCSLAEAPDVIRYDATIPFQPGQQLTIVAGIRKGAIAEPSIALEKKPRDPTQFFEMRNPLTFGGTALLLFGGLGFLAVNWWQRGRDRRYTTLHYLTENPEEETRPFFQGQPVVVEFQPPEKLKPAQIGLLLDERADSKDVTATVVDLAVRGYLTIAEVRKKWFFSRRDWLLTRRREDTDGLEAYERTIIDGIFSSGDEVKLSDLKNKFYTHLQKAQEELYKDSAARKWFYGSPDKVRTLWSGIGIGVIVAGIGATIALGYFFGAGMLGLPLALTGLLLLLTAKAMPRRTAAGSELVRRILGFRRYIVTAETDRQAFNERANIFAEYLPYAIVFGAVDRWARAFRDIDTAAVTAAWYAGSDGFSAASFSRNLQSFNSSVSSTVGSTPGGSGGSGFSGGSSGGGGGGGGGGSW